MSKMALHERIRGDAFCLTQYIDEQIMANIL